MGCYVPSEPNCKAVRHLQCSCPSFLPDMLMKNYTSRGKLWQNLALKQRFTCKITFGILRTCIGRLSHHDLDSGKLPRCSYSLFPPEHCFLGQILAQSLLIPFEFEDMFFSFYMKSAVSQGYTEKSCLRKPTKQQTKRVLRVF